MRWRVAVLRLRGAIDRIIRRRLTGDGVLLGQPCAEVDEPAALAAEGPERRLRPVDLALAGGALDVLDGHQGQQVRRNFTSVSPCVARSAGPFQLRKRTLQRWWLPLTSG